MELAAVDPGLPIVKVPALDAEFSPKYVVTLATEPAVRTNEPD